MKDDHCHEHNDQEPHKYYQNHPPHVHDPINGLLKSCRVQKKVCKTAESSIVVDNHAAVEEVTVARKVLAGKSDL